ncbi:MAG: 50S ribosomal protein L24 [Pseudomonadota bacterium]|nr:50S ribosomal protein L24 [Pseudomonadota bacterium]MDE3037866.1 50S ribosomal protein L24 [Pseudomonadota bacterium]
MKTKFKLKKGDEVIVIAGREKGKKGKITEVITGTSRVVVEGVNKVKRHQKPSKTGTGGIVEKEAPLHISNVMLLDAKSGKGTRVGYKIENGNKVRVARRPGAQIL